MGRKSFLMFAVGCLHNTVTIGQKRYEEVNHPSKNVNTGYEHIWSEHFPDLNAIKGKERIDSWLTPARWSDPGAVEGFMWAEVRTKGSLRYKVWVHKALRQSGCTCTIRDAVCVHRLALVLLWHEEILDFSENISPPDWVGTPPVGTPSPLARKKSSSRDPLYPDDARMDEIRQGYHLLEAWLTDTTRAGWQTTLHASSIQVEELAARLVNYRLSGPARIIRFLYGDEDEGPAMMGQLRQQLASLTLACRVMNAGPDNTDPDTWSHFMQFTGVSLRKDYIQRLDLSSHDIWLVVHTAVEQADDLSSRKTWLLSLKSRQPGFLLDFAWKRQPLADHWPVGQLLRGRMYHFPGLHNHRLLTGELEPIDGKKPDLPIIPTSWQELLRAWATQLQANPWMERFPFLIRNVTAFKAGDQTLLVDSMGEALPCVPEVADAVLLVLEDHAGQAVFGEIALGICRPLAILYPERVQTI